MIWGVEDSTVLGLAGIVAGVIATGISLWWNYKTRALPHREFLYQKQIEAYIDLATAFSRSINPCYDYLNGLSNRQELTPESRKAFRKLALRAQVDLWEQFRKSALILPQDVAVAIGELLGKLLNEVHKSGNPIQMIRILIDGEIGVYKAVRKNAGVRPLTKEMRRVFGEPTEFQL